MKKLIGYIVAVVLFTACSKNKSNEVVVTGRLMQSCETPAANKDGLILLPGGGILSNPSTSLEFTTDENGYFKVTHDESFSQFSVRTSAAHNVLEVKSLGGDEKELGEVYINPFPTNFIIHLDVKNPYTENDTLVMKDFGNPDLFAENLIPGPFENGFLDSIVNGTYDLFPINRSNVEQNGGPRYSVVFILNSTDTSYNRTTPFYISPICSEEFAEVTLVIE